MAAALLIISGCGEAGRIKEASLCAENFISAYTSGNFSAADSLCSVSLRKHLDSAAACLPTDSNVRAAAVNMASSLVWDRKVLENDDDTAVKLYCSTSFEGKKLSMTLILVQDEADRWYVSSIEKSSTPHIEL